VTDAAPSALCAVHPGSPALFTCTRCGAFACSACKARVEDVCLACWSRPSERLDSSRRARSAFFLAVLALHGLVPLAPVALWLVERERAAIASHAAPRGGEPWLAGARWVSFFALAVWGVVLSVVLKRWLDE
jgi:hypothetical protein